MLTFRVVQVCVELLKDFTVTQHCPETLCFWLEVQAFKTAPTSTLKAFSLDLYNSYLSLSPSLSIVAGLGSFSHFIGLLVGRRLHLAGTGNRRAYAYVCRYVKSDSEFQINLSSSQRAVIEGRVRDPKNSIFKEAEAVSIPSYRRSPPLSFRAALQNSLTWVVTGVAEAAQHEFVAKVLQLHRVRGVSIRSQWFGGASRAAAKRDCDRMVEAVWRR